MMEQLTREEWKAEGVNFFGDDVKKWKFQCLNCGEVQTLQDFIDAGIEEPENKFYFSCIGRWVLDRGCDWTLGGLFQLHEREVLEPESGKYVPVFEFATEDAAQPKDVAIDSNLTAGNQD